MGSEIVRLWKIIQNIFSYVRQKQVSHMGLEQHESDKMIYIYIFFLMDYAFKYLFLLTCNVCISPQRSCFSDTLDMSGRAMTL